MVTVYLDPNLATAAELIYAAICVAVYLLITRPA